MPAVATLMSAASLEGKFCWETVPSTGFVPGVCFEPNPPKTRWVGNGKTHYNLWQYSVSPLIKTKIDPHTKGGQCHPNKQTNKQEALKRILKNQVSSQHFAAEPCSLCCNVMIFEPQNVSHCAGFANIIELQLFQVFAGTTAKLDKIHKKPHF